MSTYYEFERCISKARIAAAIMSIILIFSMLGPALALTLVGWNVTPMDGGGGVQPEGTIDWKTLGRTREPVVVTASQVLDLIDTPVSHTDVFSLDNNILVYAWNGTTSTWRQIPFQVDERNPVDGSWAIDNANGVLDGYDEIVFMSGDAGDQASMDEWVVGCDAPRYEVEIVDPDTGNSAWAYIYKSSRIEANFTEDYVEFDTDVNDVFTDSYAMGFRDGVGMIIDYLNVTEGGGGDGENLVDTFEIEASATYFITRTFDENNLGADFTMKKDGYVRALGVVSWHIYQSMFGITVDAYLNFTWKFYPEHVSVIGHIEFDIDGGVVVDIWLALDHISSAIPMDYRDSGGNTGVINGIDDDNIIDPNVLEWWEVSSPHGGYVCVWDLDIESGSSGLKFDDDSSAPDHDNAEPGLYGRTGAYFDDIGHEQERIANLSFFPIPSDVSGVGEAIMHNVAYPLQITTTPQHSPTIWVEKSVNAAFAGSGHSHVWVNVPNIDANSDTDYIWMYYNNSAASDVQDESGTYDKNYMAVWHLNESGTGTRYDSTQYGNDGNPGDYDGDEATTGKIDGADDFDGSNDYVDCGNDESLNNITTELTISAWVKHRTKSLTTTVIKTKATPTGGGPSSVGYMFYIEPDNDIVFYGSNGTNWIFSPKTTADLDEWQHFVGTFNGSTAKIYKNGILKQTRTPSDDELVSDPTYSLYIGSSWGEYYNGTIDEVRISNTARSADWIKAQYLSMINSFITYGSEEPVWWNVSWSYRKKLTFDNSGQSEALVNFPVLVNLSSSNFDYSKAKLDGTDLRFIDADNVTELKYHIEDWDPDVDFYTLYFNNTGDRDANFVWINDTLPVDVIFAGHDADTSSLSAPYFVNFNQIGNTLHFEFQNVPQGVHYFNIRVTMNPGVTPGQTITNWAYCNFTNDVFEKMPESSASASFEVPATYRPDIQVEKSVDKATASPGEILQYTIYFNNTGLTAAETVWINDTLPAEVTYLSDSSATELGVKTADYNWTFTNVAPGNHLFVINVSLGNATGGTSIDNIVFLNYTAVGGIEMPSSQAWANMTVVNYIILKYGWNLISIPLIQVEQDLTIVLDSIDGLYDSVQWYDITDKNDHWKIYNIGMPFGNDLSEINERMAFWVHITQPGATIFPYNGTQPTENQSITLHPGWNLVGYPSLSNKNRTATLNNLTFGSEVDSIWTYNAATQEWVELGGSDYFEIGKGYWIHATIECVWEVPL